MSLSSRIIFGVACIFYLLSWKYIRQLLTEVNREQAVCRVSIWKWHKGWNAHRDLFPASAVRMRLAACMAATIALALIAFCIEARHMLAAVQR